MKNKITEVKEKVQVFWDENGTKIVQVAAVGIIGGATVRSAYKLGCVAGMANTLRYIECNVPEAYSIILRHVRNTIL